MSMLQYGIPLMEKPRPAAICLRIAGHAEAMSPDQIAAP